MQNTYVMTMVTIETVANLMDGFRSIEVNIYWIKTAIKKGRTCSNMSGPAIVDSLKGMSYYGEIIHPRC